MISTISNPTNLTSKVFYPLKMILNISNPSSTIPISSDASNIISTNFNPKTYYQIFLILQTWYEMFLTLRV